MKYIDTDFIHISILDAKTVLVEAMYGVEIDLEKSRYAILSSITTLNILVSIGIVGYNNSLIGPSINSYNTIIIKD